MRKLSLARFAVVSVAAASLAAVPADAAPPRYTVTTLRGLGGEPGIAVSPSGRTVLVAGLAENPAALFRSTDSGRRFTRLRPSFGAVGGADFDFVFLDDRTVVAADLAFSNGLYVHRSEDAGTTWTSLHIRHDLYDRPWIAAHGRTVYVVARGFDQVPYVYVSRDGGRSFDPPALLYSPDVEPLPTSFLVTTIVQHLATDRRTGTLYVLHQHDQGLYVSRLDGTGPAGPRFVARKVTNATADNGFNWLTTDAAGHVYVLSHEVRDGVAGSRLYASRDRGATWSAGVDLGPRDETTAFGAIAGGGAGRLSFVYLRGDGGLPDTKQDWWAEIAIVTKADTARPVVTRFRPVAKPVHQEEICSMGVLCGEDANRNLLDFVSTAIAPDGTAYAVVASDGPATGNTPADGRDIGGLVFRLRPR